MNARCLRLVFAVLLFALAGAPREASAERILFESYVGARPADADRIGVVVHAVFDRHDFVVDLPALTKIFHEHSFRPGLASPKFGDVLRKQTEAGTSEFSDSKFRKTADDLGKLIAAIRQNGLILAHDPKNRELALRAMIYYALACGRLAEPGARDVSKAEAEGFAKLRDETMTEVIRSFPSKIITAKAFGEEAELLYQRIRDQLNKAGRGKLLISVNDDDTVIYVNEVVRGTQRAEIGDLVPGRYRVLLQMATGEARQYEINVAMNQVARLDVNWDMDSLFVVGDWVGFRFPTEKEHAREAQIVSQLAQRHTNAALAATVTILRLRGRAAVIGTLYSVRDGRLLHSGRVELAGTIADEKAVDNLVEYLTGNSAVPGVTPVDHPEYVAPPPPQSTPSTAPLPASPPLVAAAVADRTVARTSAAQTWPSWVAAGGSLALLTIGGVALYKHYGPCGTVDDGCGSYYSHAGLVGYSSIAAGLALGGLATYWFVSAAGSSGSAQLTVAPTRAGLLVGWSGRL